MSTTTTAHSSRVLPPKALLLGLLIQAPLVVFQWPVSPRFPFVLGGIAALVLGLALNLSADGLFRESSVGVCPFSPAAMLVQRGPYRFTRNPMYLGMVLVCAAPALLFGVIANLFAALLFAVWVHWRFVRPEEAFLQSLFGDAYDAYRSHVPRWLGLPHAL